MYVDAKWLLAGPVENVMAAGIGARTGGYKRPLWRWAYPRAAIEFIFPEAEKRMIYYRLPRHCETNGSH